MNFIPPDTGRPHDGPDNAGCDPRTGGHRNFQKLLRRDYAPNR
jgi:hypothetical protein